MIPLFEERLVVVKKVFLREEIRVTETTRTEPHAETVTVRREDAEVTRDGP